MRQILERWQSWLVERAREWHSPAEVEWCYARLTEVAATIARSNS